jgi:preprotein translocase subunit SecA
METHHANPQTGENEEAFANLAFAKPAIAPQDRNPADPDTWGRIGRNETCPCGSGKKYKHCHGTLA